MTSRRERLTQLLSKAFDPTCLDIIDESDQHRGHAGVGASPHETHFRISIESPFFEGMSSVKSHRLVYAALQSEFQSGLHALSLRVTSRRVTSRKV